MRAHLPVTRVEAGHLVVRTELEAADGTLLAPLEVRVPLAWADLLDPTATPGVAPLVVLAAGRGEDLHIEGPVDARMASGATQALATLADRWDLPPLTVRVDEVYDTPADGGAVGLLFRRDVSSWSALLDLLDEPPGDRVTHLVVGHDPSVAPTVQAEVVAGHRDVASELGLELVEVGSTAHALLAAHGIGVDAATPALVGAGLQVAGRMRHLVLATDPPVAGAGMEPALVGVLQTGRTEVVAGDAGRTRGQRVAHLLGSPLARRSLRVDAANDTGGSCGRCAPCLITMSELALAGDPDPAAGFAARLDLDLVRRLDLGPEAGPALTSIIEGLPPAHEELRRAWSDAWDRANDAAPRPRWGDDAPPALSGAPLPQRLASALRATTGQPVAPAPAPLGWREGAVAVRPPLGLHDEIRALADTAPDRPHGWAVVEHHIRDGARDGRQADLALALAGHHGPGPTYLPGILWAHLDPPVLGAAAVRTLLRTARARLWWRADGDLETLRVVESIEQGCLPLQVMPAAAARELARELPSALVPVVVPAEALDDLDLTPAAVARLLGPVVDHLLSGSAEHDLLAGAYA